MGKRDAVELTHEVDATLRAQRRRSLARKIRLMTPEMVANSISEAKAEEYGLGKEWKDKVND